MSQHRHEETGDSLGDGENTEKKLYIPTIAVVLCCPFTPSQHTKVYEKTKVRWDKIQYALRWLKENNLLYAECDIPPRAKVKPIVVDKDEVDSESSSNVELVFDINAVKNRTSLKKTVRTTSFVNMLYHDCSTKQPRCCI